MEQYIEKAAVENILRNLWQTDNGQNSEHRICYNKALQEVQCKLDTLEVKEVDFDFEKEIDKFYGMYRKDGQTFSLEDNEECLDWKVGCNPEFEKWYAKYFFELGLKAQKGE